MNITRNMKNYEKEITNDILNEIIMPKRSLLTKLLIEFINIHSIKLIDDSKNLKVVSFEYEMPFEFNYVGYPESEIIAQDYWNDHHHIDISNESDDDKIEQIFKKHGFELVEDESYHWENEDNGEYIEANFIFEKLEDDLFHEAWTEAKRMTNSNYRCFFFQHDSYYGIDADTRKPAGSDDVINLLDKEGFDYILMT
tara:strand:- start:272 stop:862 length:591 start_codon:yes stop_codon:yes gene_type:complete